MKEPTKGIFQKVAIIVREKYAKIFHVFIMIYSSTKSFIYRVLMPAVNQFKLLKTGET